MQILPRCGRSPLLSQLLTLLLPLIGLFWVPAASAQVRTPGAEPASTTSDPRLDQRYDPRLDPRRDRSADSSADEGQNRSRLDLREAARLGLLHDRTLRLPDEFERFVSGLAGIGPDGKPLEIRRYASDLLSRNADLSRLLSEPMPQVPTDYVVQPGDELHVALWGSVDADLRLTVDRTGRIVIPRAGAIMVAGARYSELEDIVRKRVAMTFRNFDLSVSVGELRPIRVFVSGFVGQPGSYTVGSLSTISQAVLRAGGPAASGSFRNITLRRPGQPPAAFDMYDLLIFGDRGGDLRLQPDDVVHVGPVGIQAAIIGSVNQSAVYELRAGETVRDLISMAGGLSPVADTQRVTLERLQDRDGVRVTEWSLPANEGQVMRQGDVLRAISAVVAEGSQLPQNKRVRVEGEVMHPGTYVLPPNSTLPDAIAAAGGLSSAAYLFGAEFARESVRRGQQENYERALRDVEVEVSRAMALQRSSTADESASQIQRAAATSRLLDRLRSLRPSGRVVLELKPESSDLPPLLLEDGDRLMVPARATSVGVFGSVFSTGNYLYGPDRLLGDYLRLAGGPTRGADEKSVFVIRANGTVISSRQTSGWFSGGELESEPALPGDTLFVPEELDQTTFIQSVKDWTQILYQFGLGVAAFKTLSN